MPTSVHTFQRPFLPMCIPSNVHTYQCAYLPTSIPTNVHTFQRAYLPICIPSNVHTYQCPYLTTCIPTNVHNWGVPNVHRADTLRESEQTAPSDQQTHRAHKGSRRTVKSRLCTHRCSCFTHSLAPSSSSIALPFPNAFTCAYPFTFSAYLYPQGI
jgi:hypothetical protein